MVRILPPHPQPGGGFRPLHHHHLRRLSDAELAREHRERLTARDMRAVMLILRELADREHGTCWDRRTSSGQRLRLVR
jgi:hypothetical protein